MRPIPSLLLLLAIPARQAPPKSASKLLEKPFARAVHWESSFAVATARAAKEKRPVYALFVGKGGDEEETAACEDEALSSPWWKRASDEVVLYLHERSDAPDRPDQELERRLALDSQPLPCGLFLDASGRLLLDPESPTAARSLPDSERRWRGDLELARIHADLAAILERAPDDEAANAGVVLIVAMRSEIVTEPIAEFEEAASRPKLDPRLATAWRDYRKIRPILEALDGVGVETSAASPADARAALTRRLYSLWNQGLALPLDHHRAFAFHLAALEGARRAGDAEGAQRLADRLDEIVAASFKYRRAEMKRMVDDVKAQKQ